MDTLMDSAPRAPKKAQVVTMPRLSLQMPLLGAMSESQVHWHPVASPSSVNAELDWPGFDKDCFLEHREHQTLFPTKRYDYY